MTSQHRLKRTLILLAIGLLIGGLIGLVEGMKQERRDARQTAVSGPVPLMTASKVGGPFTLVDQDGKTRTEKDFGGKYKLIYFGFTYCPAICPTELQKTAEAMRDLPPEIATQIQPIFITIDPERDTTKVLKNYVPMFDKNLIGLGGTKAQIDAIKKSYKVYAAKVPQDDTYTMDHSSFIYLMTPDDTPLYMFRTTDTAERMVEAITAYFSSLK